MFSEFRFTCLLDALDDGNKPTGSSLRTPLSFAAILMEGETVTVDCKRQLELGTPTRKPGRLRCGGRCLPLPCGQGPPAAEASSCRMHHWPTGRRADGHSNEAYLDYVRASQVTEVSQQVMHKQQVWVEPPFATDGGVRPPTSLAPGLGDRNHPGTVDDGRLEPDPAATRNGRGRRHARDASLLVLPGPRCTLRPSADDRRFPCTGRSAKINHARTKEGCSALRWFGNEALHHISVQDWSASP